MGHTALGPPWSDTGAGTGVKHPTGPPLSTQDDFASYKLMTEKVGTTCQIVGDDLLVTNPTRVKKVCSAPPLL